MRIYIPSPKSNLSKGCFTIDHTCNDTNAMEKKKAEIVSKRNTPHRVREKRAIKILNAMRYNLERATKCNTFGSMEISVGFDMSIGLVMGVIKCQRSTQTRSAHVHKHMHLYGT